MSGLVLAACLATWNAPGEIVFRGMSHVWSAVYFLLPLAFGAGGVLALSPKHHEKPEIAEAFSIPALIVGILALIAAYFMSVAVISRVQAVWWSHVKFNEGTISLGISAATAYAAITTVLIAICLYARRYSYRWAFVSHVFSAALGIAISSASVYLMLGVSPYATWRA
jgi:hypothetical protein